jgi:murein DD-endopeptidase MepM/ murein hydrolase activator NlpD
MTDCERRPIVSATSARWRGLLLIATILAVLAPGVATPRAAADANSDRNRIDVLKSQVVEDGEAVQQAVAMYNAAQARVGEVAIELAAAQKLRLADHDAHTKAAGRVRDLAIRMYMEGSEQASVPTFFNDPMRQEIADVYADVVGGDFRDDVDALNAATQDEQSAESQLEAAQAQAVTSARALASARRSAEASLTRDQGLLSTAQGDLQAVLAAAAAESAAEEREEERDLAVAAPPPPASPVSFNPSPGRYANPLRAIAALGPERIDQGVDYRGYGSIYAVGDGVVLSTYNGGWPGGTFISYRLIDGPAAGLVVYAAEDIFPLVLVGQIVTVNTVIGTMYEGPDGIETGWADPSADGITMARDAGEFYGSNSTAFGANFSQLLESLGAPSGVAQNEPATGTLPFGWPRWG